MNHGGTDWGRERTIMQKNNNPACEAPSREHEGYPSTAAGNRKAVFPAIILVGPTAIGKTAVAIEIARRFDAEIIGVDSMQVYRHMDVGTAKPTPAELREIPHHLIDIVEPDDPYNVARFVDDALAAVSRCRDQGRLPLLVGGTGLYLKGLLNGLFPEPVTAPGRQTEKDKETTRQGLVEQLRHRGHQDLFAELQLLDPDSAARIHPRDTQRLVRALEIFHLTAEPWSKHLKRRNCMTALQQQLSVSALRLGLTADRQILYQRINQRVGLMMEQGFLQEVENLLAMGYDASLPAMQSIGYRHLVQYIKGDCDWQRTRELLARDTRRYAKRQYTWFNQDPGIIWFEISQQEELIRLVARYLEDTKNHAAASPSDPVKKGC